MMTPEQLAEIKARWAAIPTSPGWQGASNWTVYNGVSDDGWIIADTYSDEITEFIAHAPDDIDALLDHIERLTLDLEEANEIRGAIDGEYSHAFEVYYDIQDRYAKKRAALKKPD